MRNHFLRAAGKALWTPAQITTALWLDAADASTVTTVSGAVSQWNDKSGNARHATQSNSARRPAYSATSLNSLPGLTFDGSDDVLLLPNAAMPSAQNSVFVVFRTGSTLVSANLIGRNFNQQAWRLATNSSFTARVTANASIAQAGTPATLTNYITAGVYDQINISATIYDGTPVTAAETSAISYNALDAAAVGAAIDINTSSAPLAVFNGVVSEIVLLHSAVSTDTRQRIYGYLAHKWGLTTNLPSGHPYKSAAPT